MTMPSVHSSHSVVFLPALLPFASQTFAQQWGLGPVTTFGSDYISIRWWGKVRADFDEPFTFYVNALTGVRLWIERSLVIDTWASTALVRSCGQWRPWF